MFILEVTFLSEIFIRENFILKNLIDGIIKMHNNRLLFKAISYPF